MTCARILILILWVALLPSISAAQARGGAGRGAAAVPRTAKQAAPFDLTGYWVAVVTQDWRFRMVMPPKGDYAGLPLNPAARKIADAWDPAKDEASGEQCRPYGAANVMRLPGRLHITWQGDETLKLETDAGTQTRSFAFRAASPAGVPSWQGTSRANWEVLPGRRGQQPLPSSLKVVTTNLRPGYLRLNGVPYSSSTTLTEYFDRIDVPDSGALLIVTTTIEDPTYLTQPYLYSTHFKRQNDASGWRPRPCGTR